MRHYSRRTEAAYVHWIRRFIAYHRMQHPRTLGAPAITAFLAWLATTLHVSASTQNQALSALLFLYHHVLHLDIGPIEPAARGKMPQRVPVVLTPAEVSLVLGRLQGTVGLIVSLLYGAGLRLQECLELRVKDLDFDARSWSAEERDRKTDARCCH